MIIKRKMRGGKSVRECETRKSTATAAVTASYGSHNS